ncbi:MAG: peptidylprolyl isomerase [Ginsengibacter sp.]
MKRLLYLFSFLIMVSCTATKKSTTKNAPVRLKIETDSGTIVVRLYDQTPLHRDNFVKLFKDDFYDGLLFHRVISDFMIQGGDPNSRNAKPGDTLGEGGLNYTIPAEFDSTLFHKKGALAMARKGDNVNPEKASSSTQFYLVDGKKLTDKELDVMEERLKFKIPESHREIYRTIGGTPFLDMNYTVFGEVESGIEAVDKIANAPKDNLNRPLTGIKMKITILK